MIFLANAGFAPYLLRIGSNDPALACSSAYEYLHKGNHSPYSHSVSSPKSNSPRLRRLAKSFERATKIDIISTWRLADMRTYPI
jgi:hypothetical protein